MSGQNRIIALVDFEENASNLIAAVDIFSRTLRAEIVFVHKLTGYSPSMAFQDVRENLAKLEKKEAYDVLNQLTRRYSFESVRYKIGHFDFPSALDQLRNDDFFDWVFVGIKESGFIKKYFLSTTALTIIDDTDFLTVAIPLLQKTAIPRHLTLLCARTSPFNMGQLELVLKSMQGIVRSIDLISFVPDDESATEQRYLNELQSNLTEISPNMKININPDNLPARGTSFFTKKQDTFLAIQQGNKALKYNIFQNTLIHEMVYTGYMPLIVISK